MNFLNDIDINQLEKDKKLFEAAEKNNTKLIIELLNAGARPHFMDSHNNTALHWSVYHGNHEMVTLLLDKKADIDLKGREGFTALHLAVNQGHLSVVKSLCKNGADVLVLNNDNFTPLHLAAITGNDKVAKLLLSFSGYKNKENLNFKGLKGNTALHLAVMKGHEPTVRLLCEKGSDVLILNNKNLTPLHLAASFGNDKVVRFLLSLPVYKNKENLNFKGLEGNTALHVAMMEGHVPVVKLLCEKGSDVLALNDLNSTPLHMASLSGSYEAARILLSLPLYKNKESINLKGKGGLTALHIAAWKEDEVMVALLCENGADILALNDDNKLPIDVIPNDINIKFLFLSIYRNEKDKYEGMIEKLIPDESSRDSLIEIFNKEIFKCRKNLIDMVVLCKDKENNILVTQPRELLAQQLAYLDNIFPFWYTTCFLWKDLNNFICRDYSIKKEEPMLCESESQYDDSEDEVMGESQCCNKMICDTLSKGVNFVTSYIPSFSNASKRKRDEADYDNVNTNNKKHKHG